MIARTDDTPRLVEEIGRLRREVGYLRELVERTASRRLAADARFIAIRRELEQKRRGFRLMGELAAILGQNLDCESVFDLVSRRINSILEMQRTAVLTPEEKGFFRVAALQGYPPEERVAIAAKRIAIDAELFDPRHPILVTGADPATRLGFLREALRLPYLIVSPVILRNEAVALLVTGRLTEQRPSLPRLGDGDVETARTVGAYLAAMLTGYRLRQAESLAKHDPLTRLPNLRGASEQLHHTLAMARRGGFFAVVMFIDLDGFKNINDTYGHAAGDAMLRSVAERLTHCVRGSDFVGRIGGDEFVVVLTRVKRPEDAGFVARKILKKISEPMIIDGVVAKAGASIGIAIFPDNGGDETSLIRAADEAMYMVKNRGKNAYAFAEK